MQGGDALANYRTFFTKPSLYQTIDKTLQLAVPATLINVFASLPIAFLLRRKTSYQRIVTTILVVPITLRTVLIAEGMLTYLRPQRSLNRALLDLHLVGTPIRLTHNYCVTMR